MLMWILAKLKRLCLLALVFFLILLCVMITNDNGSKDVTLRIRRVLLHALEKPEMPVFKNFDFTNTKTMHTVCLTHRQVKLKWTNKCLHSWLTSKNQYDLYCKECAHVQKTITVYVDNQTEMNYYKRNVWMRGVGFDIKVRLRSELPTDHTLIRNQTAYFLGRNGYPHEPYNFFHFTKQIFFPLYWMIKSTNQLQEGAQNVVFYPGPLATCERDKRVMYYNLDGYQYFRDLLFVKNNLELSAYVDKQEPDKICYQNAVFSKLFFLDKAPEAITYFKNSLNLRDDVCRPKTLTIINRTLYRRILNAEDLKKTAEDLGYHAKIVEMEKLTLKEQAQLIHCTDVLVGVAGAGLQWAYFMKDNSSVLEIAWPQKEWFFFFSSNDSTYHSEEKDVIRPLKFFQLNSECHFNPPALNVYSRDIFHLDTNISDEAGLEIFQDQRNYGYMKKPVISVGKFCNAEVNRDDFVKALKSVG